MVKQRGLGAAKMSEKVLVPVYSCESEGKLGESSTRSLYPLKCPNAGVMAWESGSQSHTGLCCSSPTGGNHTIRDGSAGICIKSGSKAAPFLIREEIQRNWND